MLYHAIMFYLCGLGSLAKSQLGKTTSEMTTEKDEMRKEYMEVGK